MSQDANMERSNNEEKKKTRRTRKDEEGRDFQCPCGKSYLSYPALYTHIKTKHQGKAPREDGSIVAKVEFEQENEHKDPLQSIQDNLIKYFPGDNIDNYPTPISSADQARINLLTEAWQTNKETYTSDPSVQNPNATIDIIFGKFLTEMKERVKSEAYMYICEFVTSFYKGIIAEKGDDSYCRENNGSQLPYFFNDLVLHSRLPSTEGASKGSPMNNMTFACKILYFFGAWIFEERFTNFSVKFNAN